jgi:NAD(P)H-dependent FMN reductase
VKALAIIGSPRAEASRSYQVVQQLETRLRAHGLDALEVIDLSRLHLSGCDGSLVCVEQGEEHCPHYGEIAAIVAAMRRADGIILAAPVHSFHVSALMKTFIDQLVFVTHRPCFFGKPALVITSAAGAGHRPVLDYLEATCKRWGFHGVGRLGVHSPALTHPPYQARLAGELERLARAFADAIAQPAAPRPQLADLITFRTMRALVVHTRDQSPRDYAYWSAQGWLQQPYYQPARIGPIQNALAGLFEALLRTAIRRMWMRPTR